MKRRVIRAATVSDHVADICSTFERMLIEQGATEVTRVYGVGDEFWLNLCVELNIKGYSAELYCNLADGRKWVAIDPVRPSGDVITIQVFNDYLVAANRLVEVYNIASMCFKSMS